MNQNGDILFLGLAAGVLGSLVGGMMLGVGIALITSGAPGGAYVGWLLLLPAAPAGALPGWILAKRLVRRMGK